MKKIFSHDQIKEIISLYNDTLSSTKIATLFDVNFKVILRVLRENNVKIRKQIINLTSNQEKYFVKLYEVGKSIKEIAKNNNIDKAVMAKIIKKYVKNIRKVTSYTKLFSEKETFNIIKDYYADKSNKSLAEKYNCNIGNIKTTIMDFLYSKDYILCKICKNNKHQNYFFANKRFVICNACRADISNKNKIIRKKNRSVKRKNSPKDRIAHNVSSYISNALKQRGLKKNTNTIFNALTYSKSDLVNHIKSKLEPWMDFNNYGRYDKHTWDDNDSATWTWQIDHIIPQSLFSYTSIFDDNFKKCWALDNLRPLSSKQNYLDGVRRTRHVL